MALIRTISTALLLTAIMVAGARGALADDDDHGSDTDLCSEREDHDAARLAVEHGHIRPLEELLDSLTPRVRSRLIEIEFECEDGHFVYALKIRTDDGHIIEIEVDAVTGEILEQH